MRYLFTVILIFMSLLPYSQSISLNIDSSIKQTVINNIDTVSFKKSIYLDNIGLFSSKIKYSRYINDSLKLDFSEKENFSGQYFYIHDTLALVITSEKRYETIVLFFINDSIHPFYEQTDHENAKLYSLTENGQLTDCLLVPINKIKIKISSKIKKDIKEPLYGFIEFETLDYFFDSRLYTFSERDKYKKKVTVSMYFMLAYNKK